MGPPGDSPITRLGWEQLSEQSWTDLVDLGLPTQLANLSEDIGERNDRQVRVFTVPTLEAGIASLAVPFTEDDGILFDPSLLNHPGEMTEEIARGLAYMLYPGWVASGLEDYDEMNAFASVVTRVLISWLPRQASDIDLTAQLVLRNLRRS